MRKCGEMMVLWIVITYMVSLGKEEEQEKIVRKMVNKWKQVTPDNQFKYFNQRFSGPRKKVLLISGIDTLAEYDQLMHNLGSDKEFIELHRAWDACKVEGTTQNHFWSENTLE
jgi:hypothetical protein